MRTSLVVALVSLLALCAAAQQQPSLTETVEVRLIEIDAVVTDRKGNHIHGLTAADFELLENGRPQTITNFTEVRESVAVGPSGVTTTATMETAAPPAQRQPRNLVIVVDALPLRGRPRRNLFADLQALVEKTMGEGDRAQVLTWHDRSGMREATPMTLARAEVLAALTQAEATLHADPADLMVDVEAEWYREMASVIEKDGMRFQGEANVTGTAHQQAAHHLALMRRKTAAFQRVIAATAKPTHRNVMVYVSGAFPVNAGTKSFAGLQARADVSARSDYSTAPMLEAITRTANSHGVILYALRPDLSSTTPRIRNLFTEVDAEFDGRAEIRPHVFDIGLDETLLQEDAQALNLITGPTGGSAAIGSAAIKDAVDRIARDLGSYYTLAYRAPSDGSDRERRIEVRPRDRKHVVRTRKTILDRSDETRARDLLVARLFEAGSEGQMAFEIQTGAPKPAAGNQVLIPIELTIPVEQLRFEKEGNELAARYSVLLITGKDIGRISRLIDDSQRLVVEEGKERAGVVRYRFDLKVAAGQTTNASIAVFDEKSGLVGTESIEVAAGEVRGQAVSSVASADGAWRDALRRANEERKPVLVYFRPKRCRNCPGFERDVLAHPAIQRRLSGVVFVTLPPTAGELANVWTSRDEGFGVFDRQGTFRLSFDGLPDTATLGIILDDIDAVAPYFERAVAAAENGEPHEGEVDSAIALIMLGRRDEARAALERALAHGEPETRQYASIALALLDAQAGRAPGALRELDAIIAGAFTPDVAGEAWLAIGLVRRMTRAYDQAELAFAKARDLLQGESRIAATSPDALSALENRSGAGGPIQIVPLGEQVVSGRVNVATTVASAEIATVAFTLDGAEVARVQRPPFTATLDLGDVPEERTIGVIAFDGLGVETGRDELTVNGGGERFWFRIVDPAQGPASGRTAVTMRLRAPADQAVQRVAISWNDEVQAVVTQPPWETSVSIPAGQIGVLRGVAFLADGRSAEDAVLLNATGHTERADVQLVELPVTVGDPSAQLDAKSFVVREGSRRLHAESVQRPADAPLTVGFVIDTSGSMQDDLVNVQEAALGFLDRILGDRDRAFLVAFSSRAKLVQPPTTDKALLREKMRSLRARGSTALYDAIAVGLLQLQGVKGRRALVVFTDGGDLTSRYGTTDIATLAKRTHVPIHLIATTPDRDAVKMGGGRPVELSWGAMYRSLSRMAESTGGRGYTLQQLDDLPQVYQQIADALRSQYLVFVRAEPGRHENDWRAIDVAARGVTLFAPEGYYAPW